MWRLFGHSYEYPDHPRFPDIVTRVQHVVLLPIKLVAGLYGGEISVSRDVAKTPLNLSLHQQQGRRVGILVARRSPI